MTSTSLRVGAATGGTAVAATRDGFGARLRALLRRPLTRLYLATCATWLAFGTGLVSLADELRFSATTGELVMVPVLVTGLLHVIVRRQPELWKGRLGHGDYVGAGIGVALALGILWWHPTVQLNDGGIKRLDLLALPLVLASGLVLMLGLRILVAGMFPLLFTFLAWPYPWTVVETGTVAGLAHATYRASAWLVALVGAGRALPDVGENVLRIGSGTAGFEISVAPACSGFTGLVAATIMSVAALFLLRGSGPRKLAWLATGLAATWLATLLRIVLLATVGSRLGAGAALGVLHPVAGLLLDSLVFAGMLSAAGRFGLRFVPQQPGLRPDGPRYPPPRASAVLVRLGLTTGLCALFAGLNLVGGVGPEATAEARMVPPVSLGTLRQLDPRADLVGEQSWSRVFFGRSSSWNRYRMQARFQRRAGSIWVDSIVVTDPASLRVHSVLDCYTFHRSQVARHDELRLAGGVRASVIVVRLVEGDIWYSLHWQRPVAGDRLRYERVVLMTAQPARAGAFAADDDSAARLLRPVTVDPRVVAGLAVTANRLLAGEYA